MKNIVLCDDHRAFRDGLELLINGQQGLHVSGSYANCNQLLERLNPAETDLILLDINMPGIGGISGLGLIKSTYPAIKVIMLTVFDDDKSVFACMQNGADGYLLKKSHPDKIIEGVKDVLTGGAAMNPSIARQVLELFAIKTYREPDYNLTTRENEILHLLVEGANYKEIALQLFISWETVRSHVKNIYEKLKVNSKAEAVSKILKNRLS